MTFTSLRTQEFIGTVQKIQRPQTPDISQGSSDAPRCGYSAQVLEALNKVEVNSVSCRLSGTLT
jgi:glutaredoxin-related protein